jgi:hypothetical protein
MSDLGSRVDVDDTFPFLVLGSRISATIDREGDAAWRRLEPAFDSSSNKGLRQNIRDPFEFDQTQHAASTSPSVARRALKQMEHSHF